MTFGYQCSQYISCYDSCQCSDDSCLSACQSLIIPTCESDDANLVSCLKTQCAVPCGAETDAG